jgi:hypothetical protein
VTWYAKQAQFEFLDTAGTSHIAATVSIRSVDGSRKMVKSREWLRVSDFRSRAVRWYAERLSTSNGASILLLAPAVTILQMQVGG